MSNTMTGAAPVAPDLLTTNEHGGTQSHIEGAFHAIPPTLLTSAIRFARESHIMLAIAYIGYRLQDDPPALSHALDHVFALIYEKKTGHKVHSAPDASPLGMKIFAVGLSRIAEVRAEGIVKYHFNNWRLIKVASHIDHALRHLFLYITEDMSEDHLGHAATRLAFAIDMQRLAWQADVPYMEMPKPARAKFVEHSFGKTRHGA